MIAVTFVPRTAPGAAPVTISGETMGTTYTVRLARLPDGLTADGLQREIDRRLADVETYVLTSNRSLEREIEQLR